mgnify:CR=1 FL=1
MLFAYDEFARRLAASLEQLVKALSSEGLSGLQGVEVDGRRGPAIVGEAKLLKLGRSLAFAECTMFSEGDADPVAHAAAPVARLARWCDWAACRWTRWTTPSTCCSRSIAIRRRFPTAGRCSPEMHG